MATKTNRTHTIEMPDYGPTALGGNSADRWAAATAAVVSVVESCQAGDYLDESIYDLDDLTRDQLDRGLRERGLCRGDMTSDGCSIVHAGS